MQLSSHMQQAQHIPELGSNKFSHISMRSVFTKGSGDLTRHLWTRQPLVVLGGILKANTYRHIYEAIAQ